MKAIDLETKTVHKVTSIDFVEEIVVMHNPEYGHTRQKFDKVLLIEENGDPKIVEV